MSKDFKGNDKMDKMDGINEEDMLIVLTDEDGKEMNFVVIDAIQLDELGQYVMVSPADAEIPEDEDESEQEVLILKVIQGEEEDVFVTIEDEDELDAVFSEFERRNDELEDDEEDDDEEQ